MSELRPDALRLVCITPGDRPAADIVSLVKASLTGGGSAVLLRERALPAEVLTKLAQDLASLCQQRGALLLVSNDVELALACAADGVHLGHGGPTVAAVRRRAPGLIVGRSAHWPLGGQDRAADYVTLSPVAATPRSLPRPLLTAEQLHAAVSDPGLGPLVALGGLDAQAVATLSPDIAGVAVIRALSKAADPSQAARQLIRALDERGRGGEGEAP